VLFEVDPPSMERIIASAICAGEAVGVGTDGVVGVGTATCSSVSLLGVLRNKLIMLTKAGVAGAACGATGGVVIAASRLA
jgi:hypothetical protein